MPAQLIPVIILPFQCECAVIAYLADFNFRIVRCMYLTAIIDTDKNQNTLIINKVSTLLSVVNQIEGMSAAIQKMYG